MEGVEKVGLVAWRDEGLLCSSKFSSRLLLAPISLMTQAGGA